MPTLPARYAPRLPGISILLVIPALPSGAPGARATGYAPCAALRCPAGPLAGNPIVLRRWPLPAPFAALASVAPAYVARPSLAPSTVAVWPAPATLAPCTLPRQRAPKFDPYSRPTSHRDR
jgi:hypothetical protein